MRWCILFYSILMANAYTGNGSYNSFRRQVGFCKLQGFDTVSRSTSSGPLEETNMIGVGLNQIQFQHNISNCGRCLNITKIDNFPEWNHELTQWDASRPTSLPFTAMVMDECYDPICGDGFLDFDIYHEKQPVMCGNPRNIEWHFIDCPFRKDDIELLFCLSNTCHEDDPSDRSIADILIDADPFFWSVHVRRSPIPILSITIAETNHPLEMKEGWFYNGDRFDFLLPFSLIIASAEWSVVRTIHLVHTIPSFRGGILV